MAVQGSSSDTNAAHIGTIVVNHSKLYSKNATLVEIFGPQVQPGRELLDEITRIYKVPAVKNLTWFIGDGEQKSILRHPLNSRRQEQVLQVYKKSVQARGIIKGVRGEAWVRAPNPENNETAYLALTFGTLTEAFYAAWADADRDTYPNLKLTHRAGLDVIVYDHRAPDAVLEFL